MLWSDKSDRGAEALGLESQIGSFEVGKKFDAQLISLGLPASQIDLFLSDRKEKMPLEDLVERWWCNGTPADRKSVWVAGKLIGSK